jgi:hypothetical protein
MAPDLIFAGPLFLECTHCGAVSEFFDSRRHGYDGEQGCNTHFVGEGQPDRFACTRCGVAPLIVRANFHYDGVEDFNGEMRKRPQDFFDGLDIVGMCTGCGSLVEITSFECA